MKYLLVLALFCVGCTQEYKLGPHDGERGEDGIACESPIFEKGKIVGCMEIVSMERKGFMGLKKTMVVKETRF